MYYMYYNFGNLIEVSWTYHLKIVQSLVEYKNAIWISLYITDQWIHVVLLAVAFFLNRIVLLVLIILSVMIVIFFTIN